MRLHDNSDFTTLTWVKPELDETLVQARNALLTYVEEGEDPGQLRACANFLHQVQGTLRMVELYGAAMVAEEMEQLTRALSENTVEDRDASYGVLMQGIVQLPDYLERLQSGYRDIPIVLLPLLNGLRAARGEKDLTEAVLFSPDLTLPLPESAKGPAQPLAQEELRAKAEALSGQFQSALLRWLKDDHSPDALSSLTRVCEQLVPITDAESARRLFWVAAGTLDALSKGSFEAAKPLKQSLAKVEREIKRLAAFGDAAFRTDPPIELTKQLLYFVAHAPTDEGRISEIRKVFGLDAVSANEAELAHARSSLTGHNRALLSTVAGAIKEDLMRVKDALDLHMRTPGAETTGLGAQVEALDRVADTLGMLGLNVPRRVVEEQRSAIQDVVNGNRQADESTLLDIAGALLYVEASLDDQVERLGQAGDEASPSQNAMPSTGNRKLLEVLIKEAIGNFAQARQCYVAFVETHWDHAQLADVPRLLEEVSGALRILDINRPPLYLTAIRRFTETELLRRHRVPNGQQMDRLADSLASLEYYLEAFRDRRPNRDHILDVAEESLKALGYWPLHDEDMVDEREAQATPAMAAPGPVAVVAPVTLPVAPVVVVPEVVPEPDVLAPSAAVEPDVVPEIIPEPEPEAAVVDDAVLVVEPEVAPQPEPVSEITQVVVQPVLLAPVAVAAVVMANPAAVAPPIAAAAAVAVIQASPITGYDSSNEEIDDEIREVFLEEFEEEIGNLGQLLPTWSLTPDKPELLRPIRRVFHTLKGSGRLVGAKALGEFSWKVESLLNRVLDGSRPASPAVVAVVSEAFNTLPTLRAALQGETVYADLAGIEAVADRVAAGEEIRYVSGPPVTAAAAIPAGVAVVEAAQATAKPLELPVEAPVVEVEAAAVEEAVVDGLELSIDPVLFEILKPEVHGHLETVDAWLAQCAIRGPQPVNDPLLRSIHTMNGAFAMTEVSTITEVTAPLESYMKRSLAHQVVPNHQGIEVVADAARAIRQTIAALDKPRPILPGFRALAARISALRDYLPEALMPSVPLHLDHEEAPVAIMPQVAVMEAPDTSAIPEFSPEALVEPMLEFPAAVLEAAAAADVVPPEVPAVEVEESALLADEAAAPVDAMAFESADVADADEAAPEPEMVAETAAWSEPQALRETEAVAEYESVAELLASVEGSTPTGSAPEDEFELESEAEIAAAWAVDAPAGEAAIEEAGIDGVVTEEVLIEEVTFAEAVFEEAAIEESAAEQAVVEEAVPEAMMFEAVAMEEVVVYEVTVAEIAAEQAFADEAMLEEALIEEVPFEEAVFEEVAIEETAAEQAVVEDLVPEAMLIEEVAAEEAMVEEAAVEQTSSEHAVVEEAAFEVALIEEVATEEFVFEEAAIEEALIEEAAAEEFVVEEVAISEPEIEAAFAVAENIEATVSEPTPAEATEDSDAALAAMIAAYALEAPAGVGVPEEVDAASWESMEVESLADEQVVVDEPVDVVEEAPAEEGAEAEEADVAFLEMPAQIPLEAPTEVLATSDDFYGMSEEELEKLTSPEMEAVAEPVADAVGQVVDLTDAEVVAASSPVTDADEVAVFEQFDAFAEPADEPAVAEFVPEELAEADASMEEPSFAEGSDDYALVEVGSVTPELPEFAVADEAMLEIFADEDDAISVEVSEPAVEQEVEEPERASLESLMVPQANDPADPDADLDLTDLDPELLDIFLEESGDILDHSDGLLAKLRNDPRNQELVVGLQRDLHTLKGGARMSGIYAVGELGHAMESLLESAAEGRHPLTSIGVTVLERAFDRLHGMVARVGERKALALPAELIGQIDALSRGEPLVATVLESDQVVDAVAATDAPIEVSAGAEAGPVPVPVAIVAAAAALKPLSAPVDGLGEEDELTSVRAPQEQVRIRADLLDQLVNYAGEVAIYRARLEQQLGAFRANLGELDQTTTRLREQLRRLDIETEAQISARYLREGEDKDSGFDPLELDRFTNQQQLSRALAESANDLVNLQASLDELTRQYETLLLQQSRVSSDLQEGLMRTRMVPFDALVPRLRRVLRQASMDSGKQVQLKVDGASGEMDRNVLDRMTAPLEHMLRNSVAHSLELPADRRKAKKADEGMVRIVVLREGSEVVLKVIDDGQGLNKAAIRRKAVERGLRTADEVMSDEELYGLILETGFSTAETVSRLSGRGVGMDVVYSEIRQLGGSLQIRSNEGQGSEFIIRLPFTLAVTKAVFVKIGDTSFAVPIASVQGVGRISRAELDKQLTSESPKFVYAGEDYAIHDLGHLIGHAQAKAAESLQMPLLLARSGDLRAAICIDQVLGSREIVVKPVGPQVNSVPGIFGATIMGDGRVVIILDVAPLVRRQVAISREARMAPPAPAPVARRVPAVMVVDDSITMRKVTGRVLERHNFEVLTAKDGVDAVEKMAERVPDLVLLDIEMPRMDGYEVAQNMRNDPRLREVPIIMITSRTGDKHRQRAMEIGVNRYLGKPYQEPELMRNVYEMLGMEPVNG